MEESAHPAADHPVAFHRYRGNRWTPKGIYQRAWAALDRRPLPTRLDRLARLAVHHTRRIRFKRGQRRTGEKRRVSRAGVSLSLHPFDRPSVDRVCQAFCSVHEANEALLRPDGGWDPHPLSRESGTGIRVEEAALRIPGYLGAYDATGDPEYLERAEGAGEHLLRDRLFADGHLHLQRHLVPDLPYAFAGRALLLLWDRDRAGRGGHLDAACRIGDRLLDYPISGSTNHACAPAQLLAPLYRATGDRRYLDGAITRVSRAAITFQLPSGGWGGHESWSWYHAIILRSLIVTYACTPFVPERYAANDRLAEAISAGMNLFVERQEVSGRLSPMGELTSDREREEVAQSFQRKSVRFREGRFEPAEVSGPQPSGYELDALVTACEALGVRPGPTYGMGGWLADRAEENHFDLRTLGLGRLLGWLARTPPLREASASDAAT